MAARQGSAFPPMLDHTETEAMLATSGLPWTSLRDGFHAASGLAFIDEGIRTGTLQAPADGPVCWTTHEDLAVAASVILTTADGRFEGATPPLTGREALDLAGLCAIAGEVSGRAVHREVVDDASMRARFAERGTPPRFAEIAMGLYLASRAGELARVDPLLAELIGRPPTSMRSFLTTKLRG